MSKTAAQAATNGSTNYDRSHQRHEKAESEGSQPERISGFPLVDRFIMSLPVWLLGRRKWVVLMRLETSLVVFLKTFVRVVHFETLIVVVEVGWIAACHHRWLEQHNCHLVIVLKTMLRADEGLG